MATPEQKEEAKRVKKKAVLRFDSWIFPKFSFCNAFSKLQRISTMNRE